VNVSLGAEIGGYKVNDVYTVEYHQNDGWDQGLPGNGVVIHEYLPGVFAPAPCGSCPISILQRKFTPGTGGAGTWSSGLWTAGQTWQNPQGGSVTVLAIYPAQATATVQITSPSP
jgi:hypothetical protein